MQRTEKELNRKCKERKGEEKGERKKSFAVLLHIRDIPGSNLGPDISRSFRQFHQASSGIVPPTVSFRIHFN
jgi:hypothetical protein